MDNYASFISEALEKTKCRECVPSWEEIQMLMSRQEMLCTVHYPGPGSCQLYISSHTTANEVWETSARLPRSTSHTLPFKTSQPDPTPVTQSRRS